MNIDFDCTRCGNCCKDLRLPLSADEAVRWLCDGRPVQVLCEAIPWPAEPSGPNPYAAYKQERSFAAISGLLPIRVLVTLAAPLGDACPNLGTENRCEVYERRPTVCRIYPAGVTPFLPNIPERRRCPPEAWQGSPLVREAAYADSELRLLIKTRLNQMVSDVPSQEALCNALGIHVAAMANEGYVAHSPNSASLLWALQGGGKQTSVPAQNWEFVSNRVETVDAIRSCDAKCLLSTELASSAFEYLDLFAK